MLCRNYQQRILKSFKHKDIYNAFYHTLNNPLTLSHISLIVVIKTEVAKFLILKGATQNYLFWMMAKVFHMDDYLHCGSFSFTFSRKSS